MTNQYVTTLRQIESFLNGEAVSINMDEALNELKHEMINKAVAIKNGNNTQAAKCLGINRTTLLYYVRPKNIVEVEVDGEEQ